MSLHVQHIGDGPIRVAFLHGLFGRGRNFTGVAKALGDICTSSLIDLPNHGHSPWTRRFSYSRMVGSIADTLRRSPVRSKTPWVLVGHSFGGKVAMQMALTQPDLIGQLVVLDIAPRAYRLSPKVTAAVEGLLRLNLYNMTSRAEVDEALAATCSDRSVRALLMQNLRREQVGWSWGANFALLSANLPEIFDWQVSNPQPFNKPTLWITGQHSSQIEPDDSIEMAQLFPQTTHVEVPAGHLVHIDATEAVTAAIRNFVTPA